VEGFGRLIEQGFGGVGALLGWLFRHTSAESNSHRQEAQGGQMTNVE
jgi:hypothetical protein